MSGAITRARWIGFKTIILREFGRILRIWGQTIVPSVVTAALYFVIFGSLIGQRIGSMDGTDYMQYIAPGLIMMAVITNSYANVSSSFYGAKFGRYLEEVLVSPLPNWVIVLATSAVECCEVFWSAWQLPWWPCSSRTCLCSICPQFSWRCF
jgi:ABC-type multidrug transport system permease subunit